MLILLFLGYWFIFCLDFMACTRAQEKFRHGEQHFTLTTRSVHYCNVTWALWRLKSPATRPFVHDSSCSANNTENSNALQSWPFLRRFNGEDWFPPRKHRWSRYISNIKITNCTHASFCLIQRPLVCWPHFTTVYLYERNVARNLISWQIVISSILCFGAG